MRFDKLTTKFQQALSDAQSLAVGNDNPSIEPQHLLAALLNQDDGGTASLLAHAGTNLAPLKSALQQSLANLPKAVLAAIVLTATSFGLATAGADDRTSTFIVDLAERFLARFVKDYNRPAHGFSEAALEALRNYGWPGNVRELRNVIERASIICGQDLVDVNHLGLGDGPATGSTIS